MKRFYNNTLIGGAFSKALRVVALLCVLLGFSSSAWGETYYLWYTTTNNNNFGSTSVYKWSDAKTDNNGICTWTISGLNSGNNYFYISKTKDTSKLLNLNIYVNNKATSLLSGLDRQEYNVGNQYAKGVRVSCINSNTTITLTFDFSNSNQITVTATSGGAGGCTPSVSMVSAIFNGTQIEMKGNVTKSCGSAYRGFEYSTDGNNWMSTGGGNSASTGEYTGIWTPTKKGTTYFIRATYGNSKSSNTISVKIPAEGSESESCNVIEIYCKYLGAPTQFDMKVHLGNDENDNSIHQGYASCDDSGNGYAHWTFNTEKTGVCIIISNKEESYKTQKMCGLSKGNKYYFDIPASNWDKWSSGPTKTETLNCETNVLLSREAIVNKSAKTAQLFGYLKSIKAPNCPTSAITDYGFFYCMVNDGDTPCTPDIKNSTQLAVVQSPALSRGMEFTATVGLIKEPSDALQDGKTYYYRAYAKIDDKYILSGEIRSFSTDPCIPQYGGLSDKYNDKPIVYTINADPAFTANDCKLHFNSLQDAIDHLKATYTKDEDFRYVTRSGNSYNLNQPVIMKVHYFQSESDGKLGDGYYFGTTNVGNYAGDVEPSHSNLFEGINMDAKDAANTLTIKPGNKVAKPLIHHIVIRNSKNIVLDSLCIYSDPDGTLDNALEIDVNSTGWSSLSTGQFAEGNITIQNCLIHSYGFTGIHVSAYDGLVFKNNEFETLFKGSSDNSETKNNMLNWGASVKFLACKNIKFIQNNFIGSHPTSLWVQECQNVLFMNNVFWNTNEFVPEDGSKKTVPSAVRLVSQYENNIDNVGFYYNTFYFANNDVDASWAKFNFFNQCSIDSKSNFGSNIYFKYNNCYSYDLDCPGKYDVAGNLSTSNGGGGSATYGKTSASSTSDNFCPNNFWSKYDEAQGNTTSAFAFGCSDDAGKEFIDVSTQVCSTSAIKPSSLIVKGKSMNNGKDVNTVSPTIAASTNIALTPEEQYSDRYEMGVRPEEEGWTYGAYQSREDIQTEVIYWIGNSSDWDDRNNWEYEIEEAGVTKRIPVSCVNSFSEDLKVVIEEVGTYQVDGGRKWPQIPASFTENRTNSEHNEHVSAGLGTGKTPTKFASTIELEYGAGLRGVENLNDNGTMRYDKAIVHFDAERNKWLLVGPIVRPFDTEKNDGSTRNVNSGDYFRNFEPQIYMHGTVVDGNTISWGKTFGDLNVNVTPDTVFAINASVLYGKYYDTAEDYLKYEGIKVDDKAPIPYRFTGRFAVEEYKTDDAYKYTLKDGAGKRHLINNVYPCNLDAKEIERLGLGTINVYNYNEASFASTSASQASGNVYIKAQNGFVFTPNEGKQLNLTNDILAEGSTRTRAGEIPLPTFSLNVDNANTTKPGASNIVVRYDEFLGTSEESLLNTPKVFTRNSDTPEAYIIHNDGKYTRLDAGKEKVTIPLGVRLMKPMNLTFEKVYNEGYDEVVLVDTKTQKFYNLLKRTYTTDVLSTGDTEGRFYLNLTVSGDDDLDDEGDNPGGDDIVDDDDVSTEVEETIEEPQINIYTVDNSIVRVSSVGTVLKTIYVSDMTGRTDEYSVDGNYVELQLPVSSGVYTVTAVGETASKIGKVILK